MTPIETTFTIILLSGVPIWFFLGWRIFKILKMKYPDIYDQLGGNRRLRDKLSNRSGFEDAANTFSLFQLIFSKHKELNDVELSKLCKVMQFSFIIFASLFAYLIYYLMYGDWRG